MLDVALVRRVGDRVAIRLVTTSALVGTFVGLLRVVIATMVQAIVQLQNSHLRKWKPILAEQELESKSPKRTAGLVDAPST